MKLLMRALFAWLPLAAAVPAWSAYSCSLTTSPTEVNVTYAPAANRDVVGTYTLNCTRNPATDARTFNIWVGVTQTTAGRTAPRDIGGGSLTYFVYHTGLGSGIWLATGSTTIGSGANAAITAPMDFGSNTASTLSVNGNFYVRVPSGQTGRPAGVYIDTLPITMRLGTTSAGSLLNTASLDLNFSIPRSCRFSTAPSPININYQAFRTTAATGSSAFALTCTLGTTFTIALDKTRSVIPNVQLAYSLSLSGAGATGTAVEQNYTMNVSVDANQAGRCTTSTCSGTDTRTITITY